MVQSMTGFGSAERNGCRVEIKSVNHRFLDIYVRAPSSLNQMEIPLRNMVKERFARGKFDITITLSELASAAVEINPEAVRKMYHAFKDLQGELSIKGEIDINTFIGLHEMFIETQQKYDLEEIATIFARALDDLAGMRSREGETLAAELSRIAQTVGASNEKIMASFDGVLTEIKDKFNERLRTLLEGQDVDEGRILQEAAIFAAKLDIAEEIARINSHLAQFGEVLSGGGIIGRKLDFILQELNREVNTIASKSTDYGISGVTVEMKTAIEKMREQVQNLQ
ncbi:MAG TPA: YicC/YloC family endoribonuclease [Candidatus Sulfobium mesophilum]|nr:YicC/YloC family endoribonuclease [Candidatus Sulfobium mesophilum]